MSGLKARIRRVFKRPTCQHQWEVRGYGGAGWTLIRCVRCGMLEITS